MLFSDVSAERDVHEVTLETDQVVAKIDNLVLDDDKVDSVVTNNSFFYGGRGATYGSLLTQVHNYHTNI